MFVCRPAGPELVVVTLWEEGADAAVLVVHPDFAPFARGPVKYGPELEALTRRSKINFTLEPFFSVSHQRLVDDSGRAEARQAQPQVPVLGHADR